MIFRMHSVLTSRIFHPIALIRELCAQSILILEVKHDYSELYSTSIMGGVKRLSRIVASILRGYVVHVTYKSGKHIHIEHGVILDCPNIVLGDDITLYQNVRVFGKGTVKIGNHVVIGDSTIICASESVEIGSNTMIADHCYITDCNHGTHQGELMRKQAMRCKPVFIGQNCWIGANCCLLPGTQIGSGVVIGAGSTISEVIPEESFVVPDRHYRIILRI